MNKREKQDSKGWESTEKRLLVIMSSDKKYIYRRRLQKIGGVNLRSTWCNVYCYAMPS